MQSLLAVQQVSEAMIAFERFDLDNSGNLDVQEFYKAMQSLGMGYSFEDAENLFMMMDEDGAQGTQCRSHNHSHRA